MFYRWSEIRKVCNTFETNEQQILILKKICYMYYLFDIKF